MPVYNAENYIKQTIDSILTQTFVDFEFLIIDDGSSDKSLQILSTYTDPRIKVFKNERNIGYVRTLNKLIKLSKGEYIARQDNDDISFPKRLEKQVHFLNKNQEIGICGSNAMIFGTKKNMTFLPLHDEEIRAYMIFSNPIYHPTVMYRKTLFNELGVDKYDESLCPAEDYAMWFNASKKTKLANLTEPLLKYRIHENNTGSLNKNIQDENANKVRKDIFKFTLSMDISTEEIRLLSLIYKRDLINYENLISYEQLLIKILHKNSEIKYFNERVLKNLLFYFWTNVCFKIKNISRTKKLKVYFSSSLYNYGSLFNIISVRSVKKLIYEL